MYITNTHTKVEKENNPKEIVRILVLRIENLISNISAYSKKLNLDESKDGRKEDLRRNQ